MDSEGISNTHLPRHGRKSFRNECPGGIAAAWQINPSRHNLNITMTSLDAGNSPAKLICFFGTYIGIFKWSNYERAICVFFCVCAWLPNAFRRFSHIFVLHIPAYVSFKLPAFSRNAGAEILLTNQSFHHPTASASSRAVAEISRWTGLTLMVWPGKKWDGAPSR